MGLTNFPNGISSFGVPVIGSGDLVTTGNVYFVDSGQANASDSHKGTDKNKALLTLDAAIGKCTASQGDIIVLMPGHAETVTTAAAIALDVAGIRVVGLGRGSDRPTFSFSTSTGADINFSAANVSIENCLFQNSGIDSLAAPIDVDGADVAFINCEFKDIVTSSEQTLTWIDAGAGADRLKISGCKVRQLSAGPASFLAGLGAKEDLTVEYCDIVGNYSVANISQTSTACTDIMIQHNNMDNLNAVDVNIDLLATTDGTIRYNTLRIATSDQGTWVDASDCQLYENYGCNDDDTVGIVLIGKTLTTT